jgi:hypothetical protein
VQPRPSTKRDSAHSKRDRFCDELKGFQRDIFHLYER